MVPFEVALEDCLTRLKDGASLEDCLARYPEQAAELRPLLTAARTLETGQAVQPSSTFQARNRAQVLAYARLRPRRPKSNRVLAGFFSLNLRVGLALAGLAVACLTVVTGAAQAAVPGDTLFNWKLASEQAWRAVSPDPLSVDLALSNRRAAELLRVAGQPGREATARQNYAGALMTLEHYSDSMARQTIAVQLEAQQQQLAQAQLSMPELNQMLLELEATTATPTATSTTPTGLSIPISPSVPFVSTLPAVATDVSKTSTQVATQLAPTQLAPTASAWATPHPTLAPLTVVPTVNLPLPTAVVPAVSSVVAPAATNIPLPLVQTALPPVQTFVPPVPTVHLP